MSIFCLDHTNEFIIDQVKIIIKNYGIDVTLLDNADEEKAVSKFKNDGNALYIIHTYDYRSGWLNKARSEKLDSFVFVSREPEDLGSTLSIPNVFNCSIPGDKLSKSEKFVEFITSWPEIKSFDLLTPERKLEYLPALAILCQGYLATIAAYDNELNNSDIDEALAKMGWSNLERSLVKNLKDTLSSHVQTVTQKHWWSECLPLDSFEDKHDIFKEEIESIGGSVKQLIDCLCGDDEHTNQESLVAQAYLELANHLGSKGV